MCAKERYRHYTVAYINRFCVRYRHLLSDVEWKPSSRQEHSVTSQSSVCRRSLNSRCKRHWSSRLIYTATSQAQSAFLENGAFGRLSRKSSIINGFKALLYSGFTNNDLTRYNGKSRTIRHKVFLGRAKWNPHREKECCRNHVALLNIQTCHTVLLTGPISLMDTMITRL